MLQLRQILGIKWSDKTIAEDVLQLIDKGAIRNILNANKQK